MSDAAFNSMISEVETFSYEQCVLLLARLTEVFRNKRTESAVTEVSPIDKFFGSVGDEDSEKMLAAVQDCRRIECA